MNHPIFSQYFEVVRWMLIAQFSFLGIHMVAVLLLGPALPWIFRRSQRKLVLLKEKLLICIQQRIQWDSFLLPFSLRTVPLLVRAIREIDKEVHDTHWNQVKASIFETTLSPLAEKLTYSLQWTKRIQAIGCYLLFPDPKNEPHVLHLLDDTTPIIQYSAALCAAKLGTSQCVNRVIDAMNQASRFLRFPFREALLNGDGRVFEYLENRLEKDQHPYTQSSCLEVLSDHMNAHIADLAIRDLDAPSKNLRLTAIRALGHFPDPKSTLALIPLLHHPEWEMRAIAARALGYLRAKEALPELSRLLRDEAWWVRMNGALALKRLGAEGIQRLEQQTAEDHRAAYEIAQYVLTLSLYE